MDTEKINPVDAAHLAKYNRVYLDLDDNARDLERRRVDTLKDEHITESEYREIMVTLKTREIAVLEVLASGVDRSHYRNGLRDAYYERYEKSIARS